MAIYMTYFTTKISHLHDPFNSKSRNYHRIM